MWLSRQDSATAQDSTAGMKKLQGRGHMVLLYLKTQCWIIDTFGYSKCTGITQLLCTHWLLTQALFQNSPKSAKGQCKPRSTTLSATTKQDMNTETYLHRGWSPCSQTSPVTTQSCNPFNFLTVSQNHHKLRKKMNVGLSRICSPNVGR